MKKKKCFSIIDSMHLFVLSLKTFIILDMKMSKGAEKTELQFTWARVWECMLGLVIFFSFSRFKIAKGIIKFQLAYFI